MLNGLRNGAQGHAAAVTEAGGAPDAVAPEADGRSVIERLRDDIAVANRRVAAARFRAASRDEAAREALHAELLAARRVITEMEERHHDDVAAIRSAAAAEARHIIESAERDAARPFSDEEHP